MNGKDLAKYRADRGWTQKQLAEVVNAGLGRKHAPQKISKWERDVEPVPKVVQSFLTELQLEEALEDVPRFADGEYEPPVDPPAEPGFEDSAPPPPPGAAETAAQLLPTHGNLYSRVCEELFEMVATGVGLVGAATGNETLQRDGAIIAEDKKRLGHAYGKLAETNATFRKMITGATTSGAWMEVALVTGITTGKVLRNHQAATPDVPAARLVPDEPDQPDGEWSMNGDSGVVTFPHIA